MANLTKTELVDRISEVTDLTKKDTSAFLSAFMEVVMDAVADGDTVTMTGFAKFGSRVAAARTGRNPSTNEPLEIPEKVVPTVKVGSTFKSLVANV